MYDKRPDRDWATAAVTAALGAGVVTSFAVSRGQNPLVALGITVFATGVALLPTFRTLNCHNRFLLTFIDILSYKLYSCTVF